VGPPFLVLRLYYIGDPSFLQIMTIHKIVKIIDNRDFCYFFDLVAYPKQIDTILKITQFDNESIAKIEYTATELKDYNSSTYKEVLSFLTKRRQSSYLLKGWINAGVNQFLRFMN